MASLSDLPFETMCQVAQNLGMSDLDHLAETSRQTRAQIHLPRLERRFRIIAFFDQPSAILKLLERLARSPEISTMVRSLTALPRSSVSSRSLCSQMGRESYYRILFPRPRLSEYEDMWAFATEFNERVDQMLAVLASTNVRLLRDDTVIRVGNRVFNSDALKNELRRGNMSAFRILTLFLPRLSQVCWMVPDVRKRIFEWPGHFINITLAPPNTAVVPTDFRENAILWQFLGNTMAPAWMLELYPGQGWIRDLSVKMEANMDVQGLAECFVHLKRLHVTLVPPSNLPHRYWGSPRPLLDLPIVRSSLSLSHGGANTDAITDEPRRSTRFHLRIRFRLRSWWLRTTPHRATTGLHESPMCLPAVQPLLPRDRQH